MIKFSEHILFNFRKFLTTEAYFNFVSMIQRRDAGPYNTRGTKQRIGTIFTIIIILEFIFFSESAHLVRGRVLFEVEGEALFQVHGKPERFILTAAEVFISSFIQSMV